MLFEVKQGNSQEKLITFECVDIFITPECSNAIQNFPMYIYHILERGFIRYIILMFLSLKLSYSNMCNILLTIFHQKSTFSTEPICFSPTNPKIIVLERAYG